MGFTYYSNTFWYTLFMWFKILSKRSRQLVKSCKLYLRLITSAKKLACVLCVLFVWRTWRTERQSRIRTPRRSDVASCFAFVSTLNPDTTRAQTSSPCVSWQRLVPCRRVLTASGAQDFRPGDPWSPLRNSHVVWYCPLASWRHISLPRTQGFFHLATSGPDISAQWSGVRISRSWSIISRYVMTSSRFYSKYGASPDSYTWHVQTLCAAISWLWYGYSVLAPDKLLLTISQRLPECIIFRTSRSGDKLYYFHFWFCLLRNMK